MKIKLSPTEERKLMMVINDESHYRDVFKMASDHRQQIFELIVSHHNIDLTTIDQRTAVIKDGNLILTELPKKTE